MDGGVCLRREWSRKRVNGKWENAIVLTTGIIPPVNYPYNIFIRMETLVVPLLRTTKMETSRRRETSQIIMKRVSGRNFLNQEKKVPKAITRQGKKRAPGRFSMKTARFK